MVITSPEGEDSVYTFNLKYIQTHNKIMWKYIIIGVDSVNFVWYFGDIYKRHKDWKSTVIVNTTDLYFEVFCTLLFLAQITTLMKSMLKVDNGGDCSMFMTVSIPLQACTS